MSEHTPHDQPRPDDELDWLAFRFIAGELTGSELADFEQRLSTDQTTREAVARSVELTQAITVAEETANEPVTLPPARSRWSSRLVSMSIGAAACLAVVIVMQNLPTTRDSAHGRSSSATVELAAAWVESSDLAPPDDDIVTQDPQSGDLQDFEAEILDETLDPPSWMLAALGATVVELED